MYICKNSESNEEVLKDWLYQIHMVLDCVNKMLQAYYPGQELSLDEAQFGNAGRMPNFLTIYQRKNKHNHYIEMYILCEPNGLV